MSSDKQKIIICTDPTKKVDNPQDFSTDQVTGWGL